MQSMSAQLISQNGISVGFSSSLCAVAILYMPLFWIVIGVIVNVVG